MNTKSKLSLATLVYLAGITATANVAYGDVGRSDDMSPYIGASYGRVDVDSDEFDDDSDNSYTIYTGMDFGPIFGAELGYTNFGGTENEFFETETDGIQLSGLVHFVNTEYLDVYARAGLLFWESEIESDIGSNSNDGDEFFWAVGTDIYLVENAAIRLEYARYEVELEDDEAGIFSGGDTYNLNQISAGVKFSF